MEKKSNNHEDDEAENDDIGCSHMEGQDHESVSLEQQLAEFSKASPDPNNSGSSGVGALLELEEKVVVENGVATASAAPPRRLLPGVDELLDLEAKVRLADGTEYAAATTATAATGTEELMVLERKVIHGVGSGVEVPLGMPDDTSRGGGGGSISVSTGPDSERAVAGSVTTALESLTWGTRLGPGAFAAERVISLSETRRQSSGGGDGDVPPETAAVVPTRLLESDNERSTNQLVEALAVEEIVEAHAKPMQRWTPKRIVIATVTLGLAVVVGIILTTGFLQLRGDIDGKSNSSPTGLTPEGSENTNNQFDGDAEDLSSFSTLPPEALYEIIESAYELFDLNPSALVADSAQNKAWQWIVKQDEFILQVRTSPYDYEDRLLQRYALAVLFFSTGRLDDEDEDQDGNASRLGTDQDQLQFNVLDGTKDDCHWWGAAIQCNEHGTIIRMDLEKVGLTGRLPPELALLTGLEQLNLGHNFLTGPLPPLPFQTNLTALDLTENAFSGFIPYSYTGLTNLRELHLGSNTLSGAIPRQLGLKLNKLTSLDMEKNFLTGSIPHSVWSGLTQMEYFNLNTQRLLYGHISPMIGQWTNLQHLLLENLNRFVGGTIPTEVGLLTQLVEFSTTQSQFRGRIPSEFGLLSSLEVLDLSRNGHTGSIPSQELSRLTNLQQVYLQNNYLEGDMQLFCDVADSDEMPRLTAAVADLQKVDCSCCTCCNN